MKIEDTCNYYSVYVASLIPPETNFATMLWNLCRRNVNWRSKDCTHSEVRELAQCRNFFF